LASGPELAIGPVAPEPLADQPLAVGVARSGLWAAAGQGATLLAALLATPFTIRLLRPVRYGLWSLLRSVLTYFQLADLGMAMTSTRFASERYAQQDAAGEGTVIWTALAVTVGLTGTAAILVSLAAPFIVDNVLHIHGGLRSDGILGLRLVCLAAVAFAVTNIVNTPQQVRLRWKSLTLATSGPAVLQVAVAPILLALVGGGVVTMAALAVAAFSVAAVLNFMIGSRMQPTIRRPHVNLATLFPLLRYGGALAISGFASIPLMTAERFLLAHYRSTTAVAYYAAASALGALVAVVPIAVAQPMLPALTRLAAAGETEEHRALYHQVLRGVFMVALPAALVLAFIAHPFLALWAGPAYGEHSTVAFYVLLGGVCFNILAYVPYYQLLAAGRASTLAVIHVAELIPYVVLAAVLTSAFGVIGAAVAWSGRAVVDAVAFFAIVSRRDGLPWSPMPERWLASLLALAGFGVALWGLAQLTSELAARLALAAPATLAFALISSRFVLTEGERRGLGNLIGAVTPARFRRIRKNAPEGHGT
jgi:O-antigen/teichoic acid export membrane protein